MSIPPTSEEIQLWYHYEEIAMHFNSMLMQYRLQLLGGAGTIGTVASYLIGEKVHSDTQRRWMRLIVSIGVWVLILAAALLDVFYYNRLLRGAVNELFRFEERHPAIGMSTQIERAVGSGAGIIWVVYALVLGVLGSFVIWSFWQWKFRALDTTGISAHPEMAPELDR